MKKTKLTKKQLENLDNLFIPIENPLDIMKFQTYLNIFVFCCYLYIILMFLFIMPNKIEYWLLFVLFLHLIKLRSPNVVYRKEL